MVIFKTFFLPTENLAYYYLWEDLLGAASAGHRLGYGHPEMCGFGF